MDKVKVEMQELKGQPHGGRPTVVAWNYTQVQSRIDRTTKGLDEAAQMFILQD